MMKYLVTFFVFSALLCGQYIPVSAGAAGPAGPAGPPGIAGQDGAPGVPGYTANSISSGGGVSWVTGLQFTVSAATYVIGGTTYSSSQTTLTLAAADATNPRFDAIVVTTSNTAVVVQGTAAATPAKPDVDPDSQLLLTFVLIPANSSTPSDVAKTLSYDENVGPATEWTWTKSGTPLNLASTNNPYNGTKDIEATATVAGNYAQGVAAAPFTPAALNYLVFHIRSKATWNNARSIQIQLRLGSAAVGTALVFKEGSFGFASATTSAYQQIVIPMSLFGSVASADTIRFTMAGTGGTMGYYLDLVTFQTGLPAATATNALSWLGTWSAVPNYSVNAVVRGSDGALYAALIANVNSTPSASNTNWAVLSPPSMRGMSFTFDGGGAAIASGKTVYFRSPVACTIKNWSIMSTTAETVTIKLWRVAGGTAIPTVSNSISTSGVSLSSGTAVVSSTVSDFTSTAIAANDWLAANITAITASQFVNYELGCQQ